MKQRVAVITGAGSGIGKAVAIALAGKNYSLALAGRRLPQLEETAALCNQAGGKSLVVQTDVADASSVANLFATTVATFSRVDLLFNNAGVNAPAIPLEDLDIEDWHRVIAINLTGVFLCLREAFKVMKTQDPRGGRIINNGSISAHSPRPDSAPYTASKHAITGLTKSGALDGRKYDIACCQIDIGNAATDMAAKMSGGVLQANRTTAPEPVMSVVHVGDAVAYMDSLPLSANVQFMTIMATTMPFIGRG
jgi:NAD(P)-dependent dehydrogenase (short-subunit alcohol dehydrogenase family)